MKFILFTICFSLSLPLHANNAELLAKVTEAVKTAKRTRAIPKKHVNLLTPGVSTTGIRKLPNNQVQHAVSELGDNIHASWQRTARLQGRTDRFKPMKVNGQPITTQDDLNKYLTSNNIPQEHHSKFRLQDDGKGNIVAHEDILNIPNRYLAPNNQAENAASAFVAMTFIDRWLAQGGRIDQQFMHAASNFVHEQWMVRNPRAKESSPELFKPFDELTTIEAKKDVDIVNDALKIYKNRLTAQDTEKLKKAGQRLRATETAR